METHKNENEINDKKLELEHEKIQLDKDRLKIDKFKAWWTGISIFIPLLVVALTLSFNSWQQIRNSQTIRSFATATNGQIQVCQCCCQFGLVGL